MVMSARRGSAIAGKELTWPTHLMRYSMFDVDSRRISRPHRRGSARPPVEDVIAGVPHSSTTIDAHASNTPKDATTTDLRLRVEAVHPLVQPRLEHPRYQNPVRASWKGVSVFLSMFDLPDVARVFCPRRARVPVRREPRHAPGPQEDHGRQSRRPTISTRSTERPTLRRRPYRPSTTLIESGKVLALNMPAGTNPGARPRRSASCSRMRGSNRCCADRRR